MKDIVDKWIESVNWKLGSFSLLPIVFGVMMSTLDIGMMSIAKLSKTGKIPYQPALSFATFLYALSPYVFFKSLNYESMTTMNLIWDLTSDILVTLLGVVYFKESIKGIRWLAVLFAMLSIGLFAYTE